MWSQKFCKFYQILFSFEINVHQRRVYCVDGAQHLRLCASAISGLIENVMKTMTCE